ncbi:helix-turn-helix domain-containing protein, partial [Nitrosomonas sp.]
MPKAYSEDLRRRVVADTDKGLSIRAVADKYSVSPSFVSKITCLWKQEGSVSSRRIGGYRCHALEAHAAEVRGKLLEDKGIT